MGEMGVVLCVSSVMGESHRFISDSGTGPCVTRCEIVVSLVVCMVTVYVQRGFNISAVFVILL